MILPSTPPAYLLDNIFVLNSFHKIHPRSTILVNDNLSLKLAEAARESDIIEMKTQNGRRFPLKGFKRICPSYEGETQVPVLV